MNQEILDAARVLRYHTMPVIHRQTTGEHSARVALIIMEIYPNAGAELLRAALMHDLAEYYTGDVPAPAKWDSKFLKDALDESEEIWMINVGLRFPDLSQFGRDVLKFADLAELVMYCMDEAVLGNRSMLKVGRRGMDAMYMKAPTAEASELAYDLEARLAALEQTV